MQSLLRKILPLLVLFSCQFTRAQEAVYGQSLLWKITGNGLRQPSYLYGTLHFIPKGEFFITNAVVAAFESSKILATEHAAFMRYIPREVWYRQRKDMFLPDEKTLADLMPAADFDTLTRYMREELRIPKPRYLTYIRLKPYYLSGALLYWLQPKSTGYESFFWNRAKARNAGPHYMLFEGLEEPKQNFAAFDSLERLYQTADLMDEVRDGFAVYKSLVDRYAAQDIESIYEESAKNAGLHHLLVVARNEAWMGKLRKLIHSQPTFVAVGAAHLAGPAGLIELLTREGYQVLPVHDTTINSIWTYGLSDQEY